jgi:hypothetical protein
VEEQLAALARRLNTAGDEELLAYLGTLFPSCQTDAGAPIKSDAVL